MVWLIFCSAKVGSEMAVYTHNEIASSPDVSWLSLTANITSITSNQVVLTNSDGTLTVLTGSGFAGTTGAGGSLTAGSITSMVRTNAGGTVTYETATGFTYAATSFSTQLTAFGVAGPVSEIFNGNDTFNGFSGTDRFLSSAGNDIFNGGDGLDGIRYAGPFHNGAVAITLSATSTVTGNATVGTDTLNSIEIFIGSNSGAGDDFTATSSFVGSNGDFNIFEGRGGNDRITGNGNTRLHYTEATSGVNVNLATGIASGDTTVGTDTFTGVNSVRGSDFGDTITGNATTNVLIGDLGNDTIAGGGGSDFARFTDLSSAATWRYNANGTWSVTTPTDGTDTLSQIEYMDFADRRVRLYRLEGEDLAGDFNGDGRDDVLLRHNNGAVATWETSTTGSVETARVLGVVPHASATPGGYTIAGVGDFNGNGTDDILYRQDTGALVMWSMNGGTASPGGALPLPLEWHMHTVADFNGDGTDDLLLRNANTDALLVWQVSNFGVTGGGSIGQVTGTWRLLGTGDFNGDSKDDMLWYDRATNVLSTWQMDGTSATGLGGLGQLDATWRVLAVADFNGDGSDDILWRHESGALAQWQMSGGAVVGSSVFATVSDDLLFQNAGTYNAGNTADLLWKNSATGAVELWSMNGTTVTGSQVLRTPIDDWFVA